MRGDDTWYAFECYCHLDSPSGLVFDVRLGKDIAEPTHMKCPACGAKCDMRESWPADDGGYGSNGQPNLARERRHEELLERLDRLISALEKRSP